MRFSQKCQLMVFHWSLSDSKSPQVSWTLLCTLADFNDAVVSIVLILPLVSNSLSSFSKLLGTVPNTPTAVGITITFMFKLLLLLYLLQVFHTCIS